MLRIGSIGLEMVCRQSLFAVSRNGANVEGLSDEEEGEEAPGYE